MLSFFLYPALVFSSLGFLTFPIGWALHAREQARAARRPLHKLLALHLKTRGSYEPVGRDE